MENDAIWPVNTIVRNKKQGTMAIVIPANCPPRPDVTQLQTIGVDRPWVMNALTAEWEVVWQPERELPDGIAHTATPAWEQGERYKPVGREGVRYAHWDGKWYIEIYREKKLFTVEMLRSLIELMEQENVTTPN